MIKEEGKLTDGENIAKYSIEYNKLSGDHMLFVGNHAWYGSFNHMKTMLGQVIAQHNLKRVEDN